MAVNRGCSCSHSGPRCRLSLQSKKLQRPQISRKPPLVQLLTRWPDTQALVCVSDHPAFGAMAECQRRGIAVPGKLAIAGFGGFEVGASCHPRLSTVAVDCIGIGRAAGELLLRAIAAQRNDELLPPETVLIPLRVELRGST